MSKTKAKNPLSQAPSQTIPKYKNTFCFLSRIKSAIRPTSDERSRALLRENTVVLSGPNISSSSSVKLRKSSNIFSTLVRKARRKKTGSKNGHDAVKNLHASSQNLSGSSTLSAHIEEEVEINCQNFEKKCSQNQEMFWEGRGICSETNTSNHSEPSSKTSRNIFNLRTTQSYNGLKVDNVSTNFEQSHIHKNHEISKEKTVENADRKGISQEDTLISSYQSFGKIALNTTHAEALQYLQDIIDGFQESENHIINLLAKYISDPTTQQEMKNAISKHSKLQREAERRSTSLANDIWIQQLEIGRAQEKIIQSTLQSLVNQNRQLQIENEDLYRKYEGANNFADQKTRFQESDPQIDALLRHNEKLKTKLETSFKKIESLESELNTLQKQNDTMEDQLRQSTGKIQSLKAAFHQIKTDYDIEQVANNFKLESKDRILQEACELGNLVLDDVDRLKLQFKNLPFDFNWPKVKPKTDSLTDFIHICRSCIHDLSNELVNLYSEITCRNKDIEILGETNINLQETLKTYVTELETMSKKVEESKLVQNEKYLLEQNSKILESELQLTTQKTEKLKNEYELEKAQLLQNLMGHEKYIRELEDNNQMIEQTKLFITNITSENYSLQNEIATLNRIIKETGAGDIVKEIEQKHEEIDYFKRELEKVRNENMQLKAQSDTAQHENAILITNQELAYKTLQRQIQEFERLNEDNKSLKQKIETEHQTVTSLQTERMKYLEEKSLLKSIIQHLKIELSKIRQLEDNLSTVSREASKLSLIAEYNKQQGDKFKQEIIERDSIIVQMQTSLQKLNEIQLENSKEKLVLCQQLNEASQLKERLSDVLNTEVKKNAELGQSKEAIVKSVSSQIQRIEDKHRNERTAIRILLRDIKTATQEKEAAVKEQYQLQVDIQQLKTKLSEQEEKYKNVSKDLSNKSDEVKELRKEIDRYEKLRKESNAQIESETSKYELNVKQLKKLIEQLRGDKNDLEKSNDYLKHNVEKLYKDLNELRRSEKTTLDSLHKAIKEHEEIKALLNEKTRVSRDIMTEKEKITEEKYQLISENNNLTKETECLNALMDKVVNDFEKSLKTAEDKEKMFKQELDESKRILYDYNKEIQDLKQSMELKERRIEELQDIGKMEHLHEKRFNRLKEEKDQLEIECRKLKELKTDLETQLYDLQDDFSKLKSHISHLESESDILESQLKMVLDQKEDDYIFYKKHIAEISKTREELEDQSQKEILNLRTQIQDLNNRLINEKTAYETLSQIHKDISGKFMKSIKDLVEEKNAKHDVQDRANKSKVYIENLENEKKELLKEVKKLSDQLENSQKNIQRMHEEKLILESNYNMTVDKCVRLEEQISHIQMDRQKEYIQCITEISKDDDTAQEEIETLRNELEVNFATIHRLKMEISELQKQVTLLQLQKSEITLKLHETEKRLETEKNMGEQLKNTQKLLLAAVLQLKDEGKVGSSDCIHLLHMVSSSSQLTLDTKTEK